jgi:SNF2 family DNA or RNA helicase
LEYKIEPWAHQKKGIELATPLPFFAFLFDPGTGKTGTTINTLRIKFNTNKKILRTLIFCPPIVIKNWGNEWAMHASLPPGKVHLLVGSGKSRLKAFQRAAYDGEKRVGAVYVTNYESLLMPELYEAFLSWAPEALVFDESQKLKEPKAKRSKLAENLSNPWDKAAKAPGPKPYTYILSGTPVLNSPMDLFMQFLILDGGVTFGDNFFVFRSRFFVDRNAGIPKDRYFPNWQIRPGGLDEMSRLMARHSLVVKKSECLDLPPLVQQTLLVEMTPDQKRMYDQMKKELLTFLETPSGETQAVVAQLAITKALRLMQIASGYAKTTEGEEVSLGETPKLTALRDLLTELTPNHKVLVWAVWKENYAQIREVCRELGVGYVEVHGETPAAARFDRVDEFNRDPGCRVFIGHPGAGGIGINLVSAAYSIFYSRNFSLEQSLQAEARNHRGGSEIHARVTRIDLVTEGTIEELIQKKLASKLDMSNTLLRDLSLMLKET